MAKKQIFYIMKRTIISSNHFTKKSSMKKFIIISLITCASLFHNTAFSVLARSLITHTKKIHRPYTTKQTSQCINKIKIQKLINKQKQLEEENAHLKQCIIAQDELIADHEDELHYLRKAVEQW